MENNFFLSLSKKEAEFLLITLNNLKDLSSLPSENAILDELIYKINNGKEYVHNFVDKALINKKETFSHIFLDNIYNKLISLFDRADEPLTISINENIKYVNPAFIRMLKFESESEILSLGLFNIVSKQDHDKIKNYFKNRLNGEIVSNIFDLELVRADGSTTLIESIHYCMPFNDSNLIISFYIDLKKINILEQKLKESEEKYRNLFESSPNAIALINLNGLIIDINFAHERIFGYKKKELLGKNLFKTPLYSPEMILLLQKRLECMSTGGKVESVVVETFRKDGSIVWISLEASFIKVGNNSFIQFIAQDITEKREADENILELKDYYKKILDSIINGVWVTNKNDTNSYTNKGMEIIAGISKDQIVGARVLSDFPKSTLNFFRPYYLKAKKELNPIFYDAIPVVTPSGRQSYQSGWLIPLIKEGIFEGIICTVEDITERKKVEQGLKESEKKLKKFNIELEQKIKERTKELKESEYNLVERVKELICLFGISKLIEKADISIDEIFHQILDLVRPAWQFPDLICARITYDNKEYKTKNFKETDWKLLNKLEVNEKLIEIEVYYLKDKLFLKEEKFLINDIGKRLKVILELKMAEKEIADLAKFPSENPNSVLRVSKKRVLYANDAAKRLFNVQKGSYIPKLLQAYVNKSLSNNAGQIMDIEIRDRIYSFSINPIEGVDYVNLYGRDITELKQAQKELIIKEKFATIGKLAGSIAHDLRNPLGVINNSAYYLSMKLKDADEKIKKHLHILEGEVQRANSFITNLLDFAKIKTMSFEKADVNNSIKSLLDKIIFPENIFLEIDLNAELPLVKLDPNQIQDAFQNIILNSIQAMPEGGKLEIKTLIQENNIEIMFKDTGIGIPRKNHQKIFEPLFTTKSNGIGLGLSIVKDIVEKHEGKIEVESVVNVGSIFTLKIPLIKKKEM